MTRAEFRALIYALDLDQKELAGMLHVAISTVSRWCSDRADGLDPPGYAIAFLRAWQHVPQTLRPFARRAILGDAA